MFRGLGTKILSNGMQGLMFNVLWRMGMDWCAPGGPARSFLLATGSFCEAVCVLTFGDNVQRCDTGAGVQVGAVRAESSALAAEAAAVRKQLGRWRRWGHVLFNHTPCTLVRRPRRGPRLWGRQAALPLLECTLLCHAIRKRAVEIV